MANIAVLGDGSWGTAIAVLLARNPEHRILLWSARPDNAQFLRTDRENRRFLPGIPLPDGIIPTEDPEEALDAATLCVTAIPTVYLRSTLRRFAKIDINVPVVSLTKGLEIETFRRPTEIIAEELKVTAGIAALSGPSHAEEVARGMPTSVVVASTDVGVACKVQSVFASERFRVYTDHDVIGVELAGALKNIMGIAAGICDGLGYGDNAKSALLTRGLVEMARFGVAMGADHATFQGLAGLGDLITTCISPFGRNRRVGERLGQGESLEAILAGMKMVAEGITTAKSVYDRIRPMGLDMPIATGVYRVLYEGLSPTAAVHSLLAREPRSERCG